MITRVFPILAVSIFACMLGSGIVVPLLPVYAQSLGASAFWLGVVFASFPISRILTTPVFGRLSDHKGRKLFIAIGLLAYGVISFGFVWVNTIFQLAALRFLHGIAGAMILPIAQAYVGDISPPGEEGKWMGCMIEPQVLDRLEDVFLDELGEANSYIFYKAVKDIGQHRETFTRNALEPLIASLKKEYSKIIGYEVNSLEKSLRKAAKK